MEIKYCKNCANFTPIYSREALKPYEDYSFGYCRVISKIEVQENRLVITPKPGTIEKMVAVNQPIVINGEKLCPAYSNLFDLFHPESFNMHLSSIQVLADLFYVKCKNCFHLFISTEEKPKEENNYTCPICFSTNIYLKAEHFRRKPEFVTDR